LNLHGRKDQEGKTADRGGKKGQKGGEKRLFKAKTEKNLPETGEADLENRLHITVAKSQERVRKSRKN